MPFVYGVVPATTQTTSGTPNTEIDALRHNPGSSRILRLVELLCWGKAAGLTAISGISFRVRLFTTGSTVGTTVVGEPRDPSAPAAGFTAAHTPTAGSGGGGNRLAIGCGAAGPGGWISPNPDSDILANAGSGDSVDVFSASGTASLGFELSSAIAE